MALSPSEIREKVRQKDRNEASEEEVRIEKFLIGGFRSITHNLTLNHAALELLIEWYRHAGWNVTLKGSQLTFSEKGQ